MMNKKIIIYSISILLIILACQVPELDLSNHSPSQNGGSAKPTVVPQGEIPNNPNPFRLDVGNATVYAFPNGLNLRKTINGDIITTIPNGQSVYITAIDIDGWVQLTWTNSENFEFRGYANGDWIVQP